MKTKLLQIILNQRPIGYLGFETGLYRFHYLDQFAPEFSISPLMPTHRTFYESSSLFAVFAQYVNIGTEGHECLLQLEKQGHMGFGHLSFVNTARPRVLPRVSIDHEWIDQQHGFEQVKNVLTAKGAVSVVFSNTGLEGLCVHIQSNSRYPDQIVCPDTKTKIHGFTTSKLLERAACFGLKTPEFERQPRANLVLIKRPDLDSLGQRLPCHNLGSLAGLSPSQANSISVQFGHEVCVQMTQRILRFIGQPKSILDELTHASDMFVNLNPLNHLWLIGRQVFFLP